MIKTRILLLSSLIGVASLSAAFWSLFALDRLKPAPQFVGSLASAPRADVVSSAREPLPPDAADVRNAQALVDRLRTAHASGDADWSELCALADAAVRLGPAAVEPLASVAREPREPRGLRFLCLEMLGRIEDGAAVPALMECLAARHAEDVRLAALTAFGANRACVARASWIFSDLARSDESPAVRARAMELLGRQGDRRAASPLRSALAADPSAGARVAAASALGVLLDPDAADPLRDAARSDPDPSVRIAAVEALGNYRDPALRPFFEAARQSDPDERVKMAARKQLWRLPAEAGE
jgi:HEAT repeat protein